jgi:signal transduction histidine kinase/CheY-like chemotaxis protein
MIDSTTDLAQMLESRRDAVVARFVMEVQRKDLPPPGVAHSLLVDHLPAFLEEVAFELRRVSSVRVSLDAEGTSATARRHGRQRWAVGYDLETLIREYGILRHCLLETLREAGAQPSIDEFDVLAKCLSVGVAEAVSEYIRQRDAQLVVQKANLEFLAEAGQVLSSSLDYRSTLSRLMALLLPRLADGCAVQLGDKESDDVHVAHQNPARADALREHVARGSTHLAMLGQSDPRSWIVVPLRVQGSSLGTMVITYDESGRTYSQEDLVLATELARRAAVAIDNARLYELSQRERSRVEAATRAKDEFVAVVSHELRTPLHSILGWIRLARRGVLTQQKQKHAEEVIERNGEALNQLVGDLLDISRVITGTMRLNPSQVDLANVVDIAVEGIGMAAEAKRITIDVQADRAHSVLRGDGDRLQQVAWNLLTNAVKFTPRGGHVHVSLERVESDILLVVEDDGEGIPPAFMPHVFESFRQSNTGAARQHGGIGLGLSIVKHIVELHGGTIEARSDGLAKGATFVVRLPVSPLLSTTIGVPRVPATDPHGAEEALPRGLEGIRVIVVDDEPDARELVAVVLETTGMEVRVAASSAEALTELGRFDPHVVLSDIGMPGEDGYALIRAIRTHPDLGKRNVAAIALTAFARNEDRTRALVEGFNQHVSKPVEPADLVRAVVDLAGGLSRRRGP